MKRAFACSILTAVLSTASFAQGAAAPVASAPDAGDKPVAKIGTTTITQRQLDLLYDQLGTAMRSQYEKSGGKAAFLENYLRKRLVVEQAEREKFDQRADVRADLESVREATIFDRYIRDVVSRKIVTDDDVRKYYDAHQDEFQIGEMVKARHLIIIGDGTGPNPKNDAAAREKIEKIATELRTQSVVPAGTDPQVAARIFEAHFADAAKKYSEDPATAPFGGELGWKGRGVYDKAFEEAAFSMRPWTMSGIIKSSFGYHLIYLEGKREPGVQPFDEVKPHIREFLLSQHSAEVIAAVTDLTNQLREKAGVAIYLQNVE